MYNKNSNKILLYMAQWGTVSKNYNKSILAYKSDRCHSSDGIGRLHQDSRFFVTIGFQADCNYLIGIQ